jgi:4-hydroxy-tetrahydrodipicolinate synthase
MTPTGLYVPLITPFAADGSVARAALEALAHQVLDDGATGLVALGTTAEPGSLTPDERHHVLHLLAGVCRDRRAPLIAGANSPGALRRLPRGATALSVVPAFLRPGPAGVHAHFTALAAAGPVPLIVYHVPYRTGQDLTAAALRELATIDGVTGIKYATGTIGPDTVDLLADPPAGFAVLGGDDVLISPLLALGAHGGILASAHLATAAFAELIEAWHTGDATRARKIGHGLAPLSAALFAEPNPTVIKAVLHAQGRIPTAAVRLPLLPARTDLVSGISDHLARYR